MEEISMKNTKAEIMEALNKAQERAERAEKARLNPEKIEKQKTEARVIESAKKSVEQNIFSRELIEKFNDLQAAIAIEQERLQELYGVGREVQKLALTVEAAKDKLAELEAEKAAKETTARESLERLRAEYAQKNAEMQADYDAKAKAMKLERTREEEEYKYNLTRTRERENNAWEDEKATRLAELVRRETQANELLQEANSKAEHIRALEEQVEGIPARLQAERDAAIAATTEALGREHAHQAALAQMERKNDVSRLEDKVTYLTKELDGANKSLAALQGKLDKAYSEMRELATKTVESASGVKIIGGEKGMG